MAKKIIDYFNKTIIIENEGVKYSELLEKFMTPFKISALEFDDYNSFIEFAIGAWNFGNMKILLPKEDSNKLFQMLKEKEGNSDLMISMIDHKVAKFKKHSNFIVEFELTEKDNEPFLKIVTESEASYLANMLENKGLFEPESTSENNYIDRQSIIIKPLQPFLDWYYNLYPEDSELIIKGCSYLIHESTDAESWLKKKYDMIFTLELESWHGNKKDWPQKRSYKMFKQWFQVDISTMVYDLEDEPIFK